MRNITEVINQLIEADNVLEEHFRPLLRKIEAQDAYLAPELAGHRWKEAMEILAKLRPPTHRNHDRLKAIFSGT